MSRPVYWAAAVRPRVLQLGPLDRTTIFSNCETQVSTSQFSDEIFVESRDMRDEDAYPESGIRSSVSWVERQALESRTVEEEVKGEEYESECDSDPANRQSSARFERRRHIVRFS